ncbi:MAG: hypothetical protein J7527_10495 [Chitinophagaceae bacterium]|nr:hypothetical protein [Chitinophagaceae bacterium]
MRSLIRPAVIALCVFASFYAIARFSNKHEKKRSQYANTNNTLGIDIPSDTNQNDSPSPRKTPLPKSNAKIQAAVLLDVSNSMDGLIDQAKAQLWNMVSVMGKATCDGAAPTVEIALYEYGRSDNDLRKGYVKQITAFTSDLDLISKQLFSLTTNGGDEYCGQVMYSSLTEMNWDTASGSYKVIFIAGNEDFLQGQLSFTKACTEARKRNVIVNTIYCGDKMQGVREHWNLGSECGSGSFTNINQDAKIDDIATPYDSTIFVLNDQLNKTYIGYGTQGSAAFKRQEEVDQMNAKMNKSVMAKRASVKAKETLYSNSSWDLVDASKDDAAAYKKVDMNTLPDSLKTKSREELKVYIDKKATERKAIQKSIEETNIKRESYIAKEKAKNATAKGDQTLETEIEKIIRQQAKQYNMTIH